jgi:metal-responsive CopG/Arc/MetJ family transcriptional regulator
MRTVQVTLDEELVKAVDRVSRRLGKSRSAFTREALREALARVRIKALEERQRAGYQRRPVRSGEFSRWETEQVWPEP